MSRDLSSVAKTGVLGHLNLGIKPSLPLLDHVAL